MASEIGTFRRSYAVSLHKVENTKMKFNDLHLMISQESASYLGKTLNDDPFVCALRVKRKPKSFVGNNSNITPVSPSSNSSSPGRPTIATSVVMAEDIIVCLWKAEPFYDSETLKNTKFEDSVSLSIDGDSSEDDSGDNEIITIKIFCTEMFLKYYHLTLEDTFFIRAVEAFGLKKAIFSVSVKETYDWLQKEEFSQGLMTEICKHDLLVRQNDVFLAPYPQSFLDDPTFDRSWYFNIKAIACAPFQVGLITSSTEIIIYFEKAIAHLPSKHRHLSGPHIEQYTDLPMMSAFLKPLTNDNEDFNFNDDKNLNSFNDFFLSSAFIIQQKIHWKKVLFQDENIDFIDLSTVLGMPRNLMKSYSIVNGTILKICLYPKDLLRDVQKDDVENFIKKEKPKQKFVKVQALSKKLDETMVLFISSILLFNLQNGPPVIMSPLLLIEKPSIPRVNSETDIDRPKISRSLSVPIDFADEIQIDIIMSPSYPPKARHMESLRKYFQIPRLLSVGDVFAVTSIDDPEFWQEAQVDTGVRKPVVFFKVRSLSKSHSEASTFYVDVEHSSLIQSGQDHSYVPLSASKYLSIGNAIYGQSIVCPGLDKYITMLEYYVMPHLNKNQDVSSFTDLMPSVLICGPRGCGKRTVINTVARKLYMHIMEVNCHDIVGEASSESKIATVINSAIKYAPCIILLRNVEMIGKEKEGFYDGPRVINKFNNSIRQVVAQSHTWPLLILATTTNVSDMSDDLLPIFLHQINIESPNEMERADIIQGLLENCDVSPDLSISHLAQRTAGFVLRDLTTLILQAKREAYHKVLKICCPDGKPASLQKEEDIVTAGVVMEQCDLEAALDEMQSLHSDSIGAPKIPSVKWDDIGGLESVKSEIIDTVQLPLHHPELLAAGLRRSGVLLYGPPGTGKTLIAKAVATECSLNFLSVKGPELINMYVGQSEENVREIFKRARSASPCIIFFDELDSLAPNRGRSGDSGGVMDRVVSQLLAELDGLHESFDVFVIGATNRPDLLDPALLRPGRFDKLLYLGTSSDWQAHLKILEALTKKFTLSPHLSLEDVAKQCPPNLTGADLYALCAEAMLNALRRKINLVENGEDTDQSKIEVDETDFKSALESLVPSVSQEDLDRYELIRASFQS
ncbi:peroxisome assembly factor 2 [Biomphalaria glabrata]|nr:peroxisome assembly factor 2-like [Biomphalaria glabrata]KAI8784803.1 peroxisome assembly factor 2 [Biomphalaria glabrata]